MVIIIGVLFISISGVRLVSGLYLILVIKGIILKKLLVVCSSV